MKKLWKRILAIAMLAVMLLAAVSCDNKKEPAKTDAAPPRDVPYEDQTEDDVVNDNF